MTNLTINPANLVSGVTVKSMLHEQYYGTKSKGQVVTLRTLNIRIKQKCSGDHLCWKWLFTWLSLVMSSVVSYFVLSFFPCDVLDEIWDAIESVPENLPTYFSA